MLENLGIVWFYDKLFVDNILQSSPAIMFKSFYCDFYTNFTRVIADLQYDISRVIICIL